MSDTDPSITVEKVLETSRNVRLGRGVVSKTSYIAAALIIMWGMIVWRWTADLTANAGLFLIGAAVSAFAIWFIKSTRTYAERNPALALLEGAELLEWRKMDVAAKGIPSQPNAPLIEGPVPENANGR
jgi:glucose-6-phosphate-specific signal transduction histidine kinase